MRDNILDDYDLTQGDDEHNPRHLIQHMAYFISELADHNDDDELSDWFNNRYDNLVEGVHEDAHMFVNASFTGDWDAFWENLEPYAPDDPNDDDDPDHLTPLQSLIYELAYLGNVTTRTEPSLWNPWPDGFYHAHYRLAQKTKAVTNDQGHPRPARGVRDAATPCNAPFYCDRCGGPDASAGARAERARLPRHAERTRPSPCSGAARAWSR